MENNNRQGCRWVLDFDFWKSSNYEPVEEGNYQGLYKYKYDMKGSGTFYTAKELLDKYLKATESESIEPCATSSENYWKQRCEAAERFINESPCDPDITKAQIYAHGIWQQLKNNPTDKEGD